MLDFSVTFIITILNITVLFLILRAILFKPVTKFMADRTKKIQAVIDNAEKNRRDAKQLLEAYEQKIAAAEAEAEALIKDAREQARSEAEALNAAGRVEAEKIIAAARVQAESEHRAAMAAFRAEAAALVVAAAGRLLRRELAGAEQLRFAREALAEMESE